MTFSIIIPIYNVASYLCACLDSVIAQTYTDWEAICIDDGSMDNSSRILDAYGAKDARIKVMHQQNQGVSVARNVALSMAHGEYMVYIDADDYVDKDYLEEIAEIVRQNDRPDVIRLGGYKAVDNSGSVTTSILKSTAGEDAIGQLCSAIIGNASLCFFVYRREPFVKVRFPLGVRYGEDDIYLMQLLSKIKTFVQTDIKGYYYRYLREGAASRVLTCYDIALLISGLQSVLGGLSLDKRDVKTILAFNHMYIRKNLFRAAQKSSRFGTGELCRCLRENSRKFGICDKHWRFVEWLQVTFFMWSGSWFMYDLWVLLGRIKKRILLRCSSCCFN